MIRRRKSRVVKVGGVSVGGRSPISVQSMAKADTVDVARVVREIRKLEAEGCEIARVAVPDKASAEAISQIKPRIGIPLVADIHFNYRLALAAMECGADCVRLNPGNINRREDVREVARCAKVYGLPIRVGVNAGSLDSSKLKDKKLSTAQRMVRSALDYIKILEEVDFYDIIVSLKASDVLTTIDAYRLMGKSCDYPFHLGVTAAGPPGPGLVKSAIGIGSLLSEGIGDTIRVSLTGSPIEEVRAARAILESLGLRRFSPEIISCPTCGRCEVDLIRIVREVDRRLRRPSHSTLVTGYWRPVRVAIMGCVVNGPGEARDADIGIACGRASGIIFKRGRKLRKVKESHIVDELLKEIRKL